MKREGKYRIIITLIAVLLCTALLAGCLPGDPAATSKPSGEPGDDTVTEVPATEAPKDLVDANLDDVVTLWGRVRTSDADADRYVFVQKTPAGNVNATEMSWGSGKAIDQLIIKEAKKEKDKDVYYLSAVRFAGGTKTDVAFSIMKDGDVDLIVSIDDTQIRFKPDNEIDHMRIDVNEFGPESYSGTLATWGEVRSLYLNGDVYIALKEDEDGRLVATKGKWSDSSAAVTAYVVGVAVSSSEDYIVTIDRVVDGNTVRESFTVNSLFAATVFSSDYEPIKGAYFADSYADHPDLSKLEQLSNDYIKNAWGYLRTAGGDEWADYYITLVESTEGELWADLSTWSEGKIYSQVRIVGVWKDHWTENNGNFYVVVEKNVKGETARFYIKGYAMDYDTIMILNFTGAVTMGSPTIDLPSTAFLIDNVDNHAKFGSGEFQPYYRNWSELITQWGNVRTNDRKPDEYAVIGAYFGGRLLARKYSWSTDQILSQAYVVGARADWRYKSYMVTLDVLTENGYERVYLSIMSGANEAHDDLYAWTYNDVNSIFYLDSFSNH